MSATKTFSATPRTVTGKHAMLKLRKEGQVPVNLTVRGATSTMLQMDERSAEQFTKQVVHLAKLEVGSESITVMRSDVTQNVLNDKILHIDLVKVDENTEVTVDVALAPNVLNSPGLKAGGVLEQSIRSVKVRCKANNIPNSIPVDLSKVGLKDRVYADALVAPEGVKILTPGRQSLLSIAIPRGMSKKDDAVGADGAAAPAAAPKAAAAAAPKAAAPKAAAPAKK